MKYLSTLQTAELWGISATRVNLLAREGRIPGAVRVAARWMIPEGTPKPADGRTKEARNTVAPAATEACFRYPTYEGLDDSAILPPLGEEELRLKRVMDAFHACRFEDADRLLGDLPRRTKNRYRRIIALRASCMISIFLCRGEQFLDSYARLSAEMQEDFPRKTEMQELVHELEASLGDSSYYRDRFRIEPGYSYHKSFLPHLGALCTISLFFSDSKSSTSQLLQAYELSCAAFDRTENYLDSQTMHMYLGCRFFLLGMRTEATYHLRIALRLAERYSLYYGVATLYYFMESAFQPALADFPEELRARLLACSEDIHRRYVAFMDAMSMNSLFKLLLHREYPYILYAAQGYSSAEIARLLHISERTVSKRYTEIYEMLGVRNKKELTELIRRTHSSQEE